MINKAILAVFCLSAFISCKSDDDGAVNIPIRDRGEVQLESEEAITTYLETHFYNYEEFQTPPNGFDYKIKFDTISGTNQDKIPLIAQVQVKPFTFQDTDYKLYVLNARKGEGTQPTFADSVFVRYRGNVLNGSKFDVAVNPIWLDLGQAIFGFSNSLNEFKSATGGTANADGTFSFSNDYGIGAVFIPAGLAYFSSPTQGIPSYSDLVFTFDLLRAVENTDTDNDGIPSFMEDLNNNFFVRDDFTDGDQFANFRDNDDDGDGLPTREEIIINEDGTISFPDSNGNGTPDYLDPETN